MKRFYILIALVTVIFSLPEVAIAQAPTPQVIEGTTPISSELRANIENCLAVLSPSGAPYYAPTFVKDEGIDFLISLAGLNLTSPEEAWSMEGGDDGQPTKVIWAGTIRVRLDGSCEPYSQDPEPPSTFIPHLASPVLAGGGSYVRFPFDRSSQYGPRGVHGSGDYGTNGMYAVDLVGGTSLGTNVMSANVYASDTGTVDYVCNDNTSVAIRTHNSGTGDYFVYAHLLNNANLTNGHTFSKGSVIGVLKSGTFNDTCGWASQTDNIYHDHWMWTPSGGAFRVEDCTIQMSDKKFHCSNGVVGVGGWLSTHSATITGTAGSDDPQGTDKAPSFWDNVVNAIVAFAGGRLAPLPEHNSPTDMIRMIINGIDLVFRLVYVFARGNLNLVPLVAMIAIVIVFRIIYGTIWVIWWIVRAIYNILPGAA